MKGPLDKLAGAVAFGLLSNDEGRYVSARVGAADGQRGHDGVGSQGRAAHRLYRGLPEQRQKGLCDQPGPLGIQAQQPAIEVIAALLTRCQSEISILQRPSLQG